MLVVWHLGWDDLHLLHSTTCLGLFGLPGLWLYGQSKWADCWNFYFQVNLIHCQTTSITL